MAHMIEENDFLFSTRTLPWHGLGDVVQEAPTSEDALKIAKLDWEVVQTPIFKQDEGSITGTFEHIPGFLANTRSDTGHVLGIVTPHYKIVQNTEAFAFTDALLDEGVKYETAGSLNNGKRVWMLAKMPDRIKLLDDEIAPYLVFTHGHDGRNAVKVAITPVRVVCNNTLNLALNGASRSWSTHHVGNMQNKLFEARRTLELAQFYMQELNTQAEALANISLTDKKVMEFLEELFPVSEDATERKTTNVEDAKTGVLYIYKNAPDLTQYRGTGWGLLNAVSDFATHAKPLRRTSTYQEGLFGRVVDGHPLIDKAFSLLVA